MKVSIKEPDVAVRDILLTNINYCMRLNGLSKEMLIDLMGMSKSTLYRRLKDGEFDIVDLVNFCKIFRLIDENGVPEVWKLFKNLLERS